MPLDLQPMKFSTVNGRRMMTEHNPYLVLNRDHQNVFIQRGQVFAAGGERMNVLPDWFDEEIKKVSKEGLEKVGWKEHKKVGRPPSKETVEKRMSEKSSEEKADKTLHLKEKKDD